jgi:hypothetical protein
MSRPALALSAFAVGAVLALAGCSDASTTDSTVRVTPTDVPGSVGAAGYNGDPSGWLNDFCQAVSPLDGAVADLRQVMTDTTDPAAWVASAQSTLTDVTANLREVAGNMNELGPPPVEAGDDIYNHVINLLNTIADVFETANIELGKINVEDVDASALERLGQVTNEINAELQAATGSVAASFDGTELQAAFASAPACQSLGV